MPIDLSSAAVCDCNPQPCPECCGICCEHSLSTSDVLSIEIWWNGAHVGDVTLTWDGSFWTGDTGDVFGSGCTTTTFTIGCGDQTCEQINLSIKQDGVEANWNQNSSCVPDPCTCDPFYVEICCLNLGINCDLDGSGDLGSHMELFITKL